jgi:hypothetical protein
MENDNSNKPKQYKLNAKEREALLAYANRVTVAKLNVYAANVALEDVRGKVTAACREVEAAEAGFSGAVGGLAQSHDMTSWRISPDFSSIEENQ